MSIYFSSSGRVEVRSGTWTFEEIYQEMLYQGKDNIHKCGNSYTFNDDLYIGNSSSSNAYVHDKNISVIVLGDKLQVYKNSTLELGLVRSNGSSHSGCSLYMPSPRFSKGFGHTSTSRSGNILLYGCKIDIECYWGFYEGNNQVEIIDCIVNGFGRLSGSNSVVRNVSFDKSNGKYGLFHGDISEFSYMYSRHTETYGGKNYAVYVDTDYTGDITYKNCFFGGYTDGLLYKDSSGGGTIEKITFLDCEIQDGYGMYAKDDDSDMVVSYTFNPIIFDSSSMPLIDTTVHCYDIDGELVFTTITDSTGSINQEVVMYQHLGNDNTGTIKTPHTIDIDVDGTIHTRTVTINRPINGMGIYLAPAGGTMDISPILSAINDLEVQQTAVTDALVNGNFISGKVDDVVVQAVDGTVMVSVVNPQQAEFNVVITVKNSLQAFARVQNETLDSFDIVLYNAAYFIEEEELLDTSNDPVTVNYVLTFI